MIAPQEDTTMSAGKLFTVAVATDDDLGNFAAGAVSDQFLDVSVRHQRDVGILQRRIDGAYLGVGLAVDKARKAVAGSAADAFAGVRIFLIEHHAERRVKRAQTQAFEVVGELLHARLVAHRRMWVGRASSRFGRVFAGVAVNVIEPFRFGVVSF